MFLKTKHFLSTKSSTIFDKQAYHKVADKVLNDLTDKLFDLEEKVTERIEGYDVEYTEGVLTLKLGKKGTFVINKQPPNRQIWFSSPVSGPKRFDYNEKEGKWLDTKESKNLQEILSTELKQLLKVNL